MKAATSWLTLVLTTLVVQPAQSQPGGVPQFQVDASWPKDLPNNWILGQVSGLAVDRQDRIWVVHRPNSLTPRERIAELHAQLGIRFPVYVMVTKCDLVAGFAEFFADFDKDERAQVWGAQFKAGPRSSCSAPCKMAA